MENQYDVVILGGGLAGLTLSIQLKRARPETTILVIEKRESEAATAAHKVGESTVELGTHYLREVLDLKGYLEEHELPKHGLRFFFPSSQKDNIATRLELGPRERLPVPSHQLDRGTLENELVRRTRSMGTEVILGSRVKDVELSKEGHQVTYIRNKQDNVVTGKWVADASSRVSILKRKLGFEKPIEHAANAVWYRLKGVIDIDDWSEDAAWKNYLKPGLRYLSTVHFMDKGYWVWVIPLGSGNTSIGIVTDPAIHPFEEHNSYEKALKWLEVNEPLCFRMLEPKSKDLMDFKILKHYAHHSGRLYDGEGRWGVTGEAGAFLDPLYSPGTDFIAMNNGWLSDLILRDLNGEDVALRSSVYEKAHLALVDSWIPIYQDKYPLMGCTQIMVVKIFWDWAIYWSVPCLLFSNKAFTDMKLLKELFSSSQGYGRKFGELSKKMQDLFIAWGPHETALYSHQYVDPFDFSYMREFQQGLEVQYTPEALIDRIGKNMEVLEKVAAQIFRLVSTKIHGTPTDLKVDPYQTTLHGPKPAETGKELPYDEALAGEISKMWFQSQKQLVE